MSKYTKRGRPAVPIKATEPHVKAMFRFMDVHKITNQQAADKTGLDASVLSNWRRGTSTPRLDLFVATCEAVGVIITLAPRAGRVKIATDDQLEMEL